MMRTSTYSRLFPPAEQIIGMATDAERAALILRLPDAIVHDMIGALMSACAEAGFALGAAYLTTRAASLSATRRIDGTLPHGIAAQVDEFRQALVVLALTEADQSATSSPTGRTNRAPRVARSAASFSGGGMTDRFPARAAERTPENPGGFPIEMTEIGPQYVIPGCESPADQKTNGGATHD